ncbi:MAG: hypothetical protein H3C35_12345 [Bacteroidetes bacterium]|nr:hypothetical protein [Bacteroidota bacterium]
MHSKLKILFLVVSVIMLFPLLFSTAPIPPPYHRYKITGFIERESGGERGNFAINLVAVFRYRPDTVVNVLSISPPGIVKGITNSSGYFSIDVRSGEKADSLSIRAMSPDSQSFIAKNWIVPVVIDSVIGEVKNQSSGCNGCTQQVDEPLSGNTYVKGYIYSINQVKFIIP